MITTNDIGSEIAKISVELLINVKDGLQIAERKVARNLCKTLKEKSPKLTGKYAEGWTAKADNSRSGAGRYKFIVYNKNKPQLTHLLEYGHSTKDGTGRIDPIPHISVSEQEAIKEFEEELQKVLAEKIGG